MEKTIHLKDVGEVVLRRSKRARRISIRITPDGKVTVTVPLHSGWGVAERFLEQKKEWVSRTLKRLAQKRPVQPAYRPGENPFTRRHRLVLRPSGNLTDTAKAHISKDKATLDYPARWTADDPSLQKIIQKLRIHVLRQEAREVLPSRLEKLARDHGYVYRRVFLKNLKTRWGSCSEAGNINLNIHLMELPDHLIDYVLLHELAHTRHKNHGPAFWEELHSTTGRARALDRELNKYHIFHEV